jgi:PAS domain S-box-containing protein
MTQANGSAADVEQRDLAVTTAPQLFAGPGEMREHCRALDWAATPLGPVERWPVALRTAVRLMLGAPVPTSLWVGPAYTLLYNDAYAGLIGANHPDALGRPGAAAWADVWPAFAPRFAAIRAGGPPDHAEAAYIPVSRVPGSVPEDAWFTYSLSALTDEEGACLAVYNVAVEVTGRVQAERQHEAARHALTAERERLRRVVLHAPVAMALHEGPEHRYVLVNAAFRRISGGRDVTGLTLREAFPDVAGQGIYEVFDQVFATGESWSGPETHVHYDRRGVGPEHAWFDLRYDPVRDMDGRVTGILNFSVDVTDQVRARREVERLLGESERARAALEAANARLRDQQLEVELANQRLQENAAELEMQGEELQATAAHLEEKTEEAEEARRLAEAERARTTGVLEAMADGYFALDAEFRIVAVNAAMERNVRLTRDALLGRVFWEVFPATVGTEYERHYRAAATEGVTAHFTDAYDDGRLALISEADVYPLAGGGVAVFWRDVTARVQAEAERERLFAESEAARAEAEAAWAAHTASERQFRTLADAIPTLAWTAKPDGHIDWYNARWYEYTGTTPEQMEGWGWQSVHDPAELPWVLDRWRAGIATGQPVEMTFPLRGADGRFRPFLTRIVPLRDAEGHVLRWFGTNTDVSPERAAREAAEAANRAKSEFLAVMSHELRTPLNAIGGYAELLEMGIRGPVTDHQREDLGRIQRSQRHLLGLVNEVLNYTKLETGSVRYDVADVVVSEALAGAEGLVAPQARARGLALVGAECAPDLTVRADPEKLRQVLVNLLSNAVKFTEPGGRIAVVCAGDGTRVRIGVQDTGIGIAADQLARIFEPFVQVRADLTRPHEGAGLGLAISRDLARGMNGDLTVESVLGSGSTFTVTLPRA